MGYIKECFSARFLLDELRTQSGPRNHVEAKRDYQRNRSISHTSVERMVVHDKVQVTLSNAV